MSSQKNIDSFFTLQAAILIFSHKNRTWSGRLRFILRSFLKLVIQYLGKCFGTWYYYWI